MMKKLTCALLAVFLVLSLTACARSLGNREAEESMASFVFKNQTERELKSVGITWLYGNEVTGSTGIQHADGSLINDKEIVFEIEEDEIPENVDYSDFGFRLNVVDTQDTIWWIELFLPLEMNKKYAFTMSLADGQLVLTHDYEAASVNMNQGSEIEPTDSMECYDLTGLWHLDEKACAGAELSEMFSGFAEWGSSMEVRSDGRISWYIGAESWTGTYTYNNDGIIAAMKSDLNEAEKDWQLYFAPNDDDQVLIMDYGDAKLVWEYGEQEDAPMGDE